MKWDFSPEPLCSVKKKTGCTAQSVLFYSNQRVNMDVEKLISAVEVNVPLWDMREKKYHRRDVQRMLWKAVADEMGAEG